MKLKTLSSSLDEPPVGLIESRLAQVWSTLFNTDVGTITRKSSFYALGGDSMKSIRFVSMCRDQGLFLSTQDVALYNTLTDIAQQVKLDQEPVKNREKALVKPKIIRKIKFCLGPNDPNLVDILPCTGTQVIAAMKTAIDPRSYILHYSWNVDNVNEQLFLQGLDKAIKAHPILRTRFFLGKKSVYQGIQDYAKPMVHYYCDKASYLREIGQRGFNFSDLAWYHVGILKKNHVITEIVLTFQHIIYDGFCLQRLVYDMFCGIHGNDPVPGAPFEPFVAKTVISRKASKTFFSKYLKNAVPHERFLNVEYTNNPRPRKFSTTCSVPMEMIQQACGLVGCSLSDFVVAGWYLNLRKYYHTNDVTFGFLNSCRKEIVDLDIIAPLFHISPRRMILRDDMSIPELIRAVHQDEARVGNHFTYYDQMIQWLGSPVQRRQFNSLINFLHLPDQAPVFSLGEAQEHLDLDQQFSNDVDLHLEIHPQEKELQFISFYCYLSENAVATILDSYNDTLTEMTNCLLNRPNETVEQVFGQHEKQRKWRLPRLDLPLALTNNWKKKQTWKMVYKTLAYCLAK